MELLLELKLLEEFAIDEDDSEFEKFVWVGVELELAILLELLDEISKLPELSVDVFSGSEEELVI